MADVPEKTIAVLGSTGSIGTNTLDVVRRSRGRYRVAALAAGRNLRLLEEQAQEFSPALACVDRAEDARMLQGRLGKKVRVVSGEEGLFETAGIPAADMVLVAIPGVVALLPTLAAIEAGKAIALASKEILVSAGDLFMAAVDRCEAEVIPVDSEHSGVFQCLRGEDGAEVSKVVLTASGGPFLDTPVGDLASVTPAQALAHPRWKMGAKVSLDSATLMNKGLEVLEAHHLFRIPLDKIEVAVHPQSLVHALVEMKDGSLLAQLANPDMRLPISYALAWPRRSPVPYGRLDIRQAPALTFREPDLEKFPCLALAYRAGEVGGTMPAVMNAANETAAAAFLAGEIGFLDIPTVIRRTMTRHRAVPVREIEDVLEADRAAREFSVRLCRDLTR